MSENIKRLVLLGAGHANIQLLKEFGKKPIEGVKVILVSDSAKPPFAPMLPGYLAGWYDLEQITFDLKEICSRYEIDFVEAKALNINHKNKDIELSNGQNCSFDYLSVNIGSLPHLPKITSTSDKIIPIRPMAGFIDRWHNFMKNAKNMVEAGRKLEVAVVGGGSTGIELSFVIYRMLAKLKIPTQIKIYQKDTYLIPDQSEKAQMRIEKLYLQRGIKIYYRHEIEEVSDTHVIAKNGQNFPFDICFIATSNNAMPWIKDSTLPLNNDGFIKTNEFLQVEGIENIFAAGDCIEFNGEKLIANGVHASKQGEVLTKNIRAFLSEKALKPYKPQAKVLTLINVGRMYCAGTWGNFFQEGFWLWNLKDRIDKSFLKRFS